MNFFSTAVKYIATAHNWAGPDGIGHRIAEHLGYSALAVLIAAVIAVPLGALIGHTGKGEAAVAGLVNALRALPTFGLMMLLVLLTHIGLMPPLVALVLLAIPPLLAATFSGVSSVDRNAVGAARAMGMTEWQVFFKAELPGALSLMVGGLRSATLQVVATATIAAYVNLGGLGRYIFSGIAVSNYSLVLVGAFLVTLLALAVDLLLALLSRAVRVPG